MLFSGHDNGVVRAWDLQSEKLIKEVKTDDKEILYLETIERNDKRNIVAVSLGQSIKVLDAEFSEPVTLLPHQAETNVLPRIATGELGAKQVIYSVTNQNIAVFDLLDGRKITESAFNARI